MIDTSAYMLKISQAGPVQLVVINFELIIDFLTAAKNAAQSATSTDDMDVFREGIQKAKNALVELTQGLDFEQPLALGFYKIYSYANQQLSDIHYTLDNEKAVVAVDEILELMQTLLEGWRKTAEKEVNSAPVGGAAPKVYSGLTYGRDGNANEYIDEGSDRGYMA